MSKLDLSKYGITGTTEIVHNPSYELLFEEETKAGLEGFEKGQVTELGAVNVMTGIYTGRSPKDKFIVMDENSKDTVWWTSDEYKNDNHPATEEAWHAVKELAKKELSDKRLFVVDAFCGANPDTRMAVRFIVEVAWQAHFVTNMFIRPTAEEGHVLDDELLPSAPRHCIDALLGKYRYERREHGGVLRPFRHRQDHALDRSEASSDRR